MSNADSTFPELSASILRQEKSILIVTIFDKFGQLVFRQVRPGYEKKFSRARRTVNTSLLRATLMLGMINEPDSRLGVPKYILISRTKYNSLACPLPSKDLAIRVTFKGRVRVPDLYNKVSTIIRDWSS